MPTQRVSELLVPITELSSREWLSIIEEWVTRLNPIFKTTRFPKLGNLGVTPCLQSLSSMLTIPHNLPLDAEGVWKTTGFSTSRDIKLWGIDRSGAWHYGILRVDSHSNGHNVSYRMKAAHLTGIKLEELLEHVRAERILAELRNQIGDFQKIARDKLAHYDHYGSLLDEDLLILNEAGIKVPTQLHLIDP